MVVLKDVCMIGLISIVFLYEVLILTQAGICITKQNNAGICITKQNNKDYSGISEEWNLEITVSNLEE